MKNKHDGSSFDDFLESEDILGYSEVIAMKRVISHHLVKTMSKKKITKSKMASDMNTSRSELDRLLDPANSSVTLRTLVKAANAVNQRINIKFAEK